MENTKILIDTDLGDDVDDAAAVMLALGCPALTVLGITTVYQDTCRRGEMVKDLLAQWGREDIPVHIGRGRALLETEDKEPEKPIQYGLLEAESGEPVQHEFLETEGGSQDNPVQRGIPEIESSAADNPVQHGLSETAVDFILDTVRKNPDVVILEMGCMTNLALAFLKDAESMRQVKIVAMGGAFFNTAPEWNIICDPEAASVVVEQSENLVMMGLDVTKFLKADQERLCGWRNRKSRAMDYYLKGVDIFQKKTGFPVTLHDVLLVAYLIDPEVVSLKQGHFSVELAGRLTRGTMVDRSNYYEIDPQVEKNFRFAQTVDVKRFWDVMEQYF